MELDGPVGAAIGGVMGAVLIIGSIISGGASGSSCVADGTLITLANGKKVKVEDLNGDETLLVWNMYTGKYDEASIGYIINHDGEQRKHKIIHASFSDGTDIEMVKDHGFYDITLNKYISLTETNYEDYIGHYFVKQASNGQLEKIQLIEVKIEEKYTGVYEVVTDKHLTCFTNGILSISSLIEGFCNIFEIDKETVSYNQEKMKKDIEKYGLFTYDDFKELIPEEAFELYQVQYLKVAMGKGDINAKEIEFLIKYYHENIDKLIKKK